MTDSSLDFSRIQHNNKTVKYNNILKHPRKLPTAKILSKYTHSGLISTANTKTKKM